ncbi:tetratricopeptide repeat protein [Nostoc sp. MS1]|uniref:tetratricopeptide repeat protein n=1 Tax=Nostoc sp. MS1 TaxID=2764711 RepID=UPI001CC3CFBD|nr:tetratricopeptide repeat protein [Nostoc sp. MS1]BCL37773.1 hypothetical protein NSMS1_42200 [Nostoc sp. MS1]
MASSSEDYIIVRKKQIERKKRLLTIVSVVSFFGSMVFSGIRVIQTAVQNQSTPSKTVTVSNESSLKEQERGYELVLQREPNNQTVMEKLSLTKLQLQDFKGANEILEKLVKSHPNRQDYKIVLEDIKRRNNHTNNNFKSK